MRRQFFYVNIKHIQENRIISAMKKQESEG